MNSFLKINFPKPALNTANFVLLFFAGLFGFSLFMVAILLIQQKATSDSAQTPARFEISDFQYFKITDKGVSLMAEGKKARENAKKENELESLKVQNLTQNGKETLRADFALYDNQVISFPNGVTYERDKVRFWSQNAYYNPESKELEGKGEFIILDKSNKIRGHNIAYKDNKVFAYNIFGILKVEE